MYPYQSTKTGFTIAQTRFFLIIAGTITFLIALGAIVFIWTQKKNKGISEVTVPQDVLVTEKKISENIKIIEDSNQKTKTVKGNPLVNEQVKKSVKLLEKNTEKKPQPTTQQLEDATQFLVGN